MRAVLSTEHAVVIAGGGPTGGEVANAEGAPGGVSLCARATSYVPMEAPTTPRDALVRKRLREFFNVWSKGGDAFRRSETRVLDSRHFQNIAHRGACGKAWVVLQDRRPMPEPAEWKSRVAELAVTIYRGREATGFTQDDSGVDVELFGGESLRADYLVGCDGGRSLIRKAAGIAFPGWDPTTSSLLAEVEMAEQPELGVHRNAFGVHSFGAGQSGTDVPPPVDRRTRLSKRPFPRRAPERPMLAALYRRWPSRRSQIL